MFKVTEIARDKFKEILAQEGKADGYVRIYVSGVG
jgi:Fe-S cluster assembly iron-binding protein IscA